MSKKLLSGIRHMTFLTAYSPPCMCQVAAAVVSLHSLRTLGQPLARTKDQPLHFPTAISPSTRSTATLHHDFADSAVDCWSRPYCERQHRPGHYTHPGRRWSPNKSTELAHATAAASQSIKHQTRRMAAMKTWLHQPTQR